MTFKGGRINQELYQEAVKLDMKDRRILSLLAEDSRMPLTKIAKNVRLSRDAVNYRIKRLESEGVILKFFPNLDFGKLGFFVFHIFLRLDETLPERQKELLKYLKAHDNVTSIIEYTDRWDLEVVWLARNLVEFDQLMMQLSENFPLVIQEKDKVETIKKYSKKFLPPILDVKMSEEIEYPIPEKASIDEKDLAILFQLSDDCRMSTYKIAEAVGLSADAVGYRIKNLLREGVIRNFTVLVNFSMLEYYFYTYTMEMRMFNAKEEAKFKAFLEKNKYIIRSAKTLGGWDLLLYIVVENPRRFHSIIKEIKKAFSSIIRTYDAWIAYKEHAFIPVPKCLAK